MKKSRLTESQIVGVLKQVDAGSKVEDVCREHGISPATYFGWKSKYGAIEASHHSSNEGPLGGERSPEADVCRPQPHP